MTASPRVDVARATGWGVFIASLVLAGIYFGVAILTLQAIAINRLAGIDYPLWAMRREGPR